MTESLFQGDTDYNAQAERDRRYQEAYEEAAERFGIEPENLIDLEQFERYERERAERQQYTPEQEVVMKSTHPEEVKLAMRQYSEKMEASITEAPTLDDKYAALRIYWSAINRASALEAGVKDRPIKRFMHYSEDGIVLSNLIPEPQKPKVLVSEETHNIAQVFTALPKNTPESVLSTLSATLIAANLEIQRRNDERRKRHELELEKYRLDQVRFLKVEARRVPLIDTLREEAELLASRSKMAHQFERYESTGGDANQYAKNFFVPASWHLIPDDFERVFGAGPSYTLPEGSQLTNEERLRSPETRDLGVDIDLAYRAYEVVSLCEDPEAIRELRTRPGWKIIFPKENFDQGYVGEIAEEWTLQKNRAEKGDLAAQKYIAEVRRGLLTKKGDVFARAESVDDIRYIRGVVTQLVGGNKAAEEIAYRTFRIFLAAAQGGAIVYYDEKGQKQYIIEGFPDASDDLTTTVHMGDWMLKNYTNGHPSGPISTCKALEKGDFKLAINTDFLRFASVKTGPDAKGPKRTLHELMWGYPAEKGKPAEKAHKLGELPWQRLPRGKWSAFMYRIFKAAREGKGLRDKLTRIAWDPSELAATDFWKDINKDLNILITPEFVTEGQLQGWGGESVVLNQKVDEMKIRIKSLLWDGINTSTENDSWLNTKGAAGNTTLSGRDTVVGFQKKAGYRDNNGNILP